MNFSMLTANILVFENLGLLYEPRHEKTSFLHMGKNKEASQIRN